MKRTIPIAIGMEKVKWLRPSKKMRMVVLRKESAESLGLIKLHFRTCLPTGRLAKEVRWHGSQSAEKALKS